MALDINAPWIMGLSIYQWTLWFMGATAGFMGGLIINFLLMYGKAIRIRYLHKLTPIEPVIISEGKIDKPVYAIKNGRFEHNGLPYVVPPGRMVPVNLWMGTVGAVYLEGIPFPLNISSKSVYFKLKDNTILAQTMRTIFHNDALKKMFSRELVSNFVLLIAIMIIAVVTVSTLFNLQGLKSNIGGLAQSVSSEVSSRMSAMETTVREAVTSTTQQPGGSGVVNPNQPAPPPTPPGG